MRESESTEQLARTLGMDPRRIASWQADVFPGGDGKVRIEVFLDPEEIQDLRRASEHERDAARGPVPIWR